jgi:hypothetical protein
MFVLSKNSVPLTQAPKRVFQRYLAFAAALEQFRHNCFVHVEFSLAASNTDPNAVHTHPNGKQHTQGHAGHWVTPHLHNHSKGHVHAHAKCSTIEAIVALFRGAALDEMLSISDGQYHSIAEIQALEDAEKAELLAKIPLPAVLSVSQWLIDVDDQSEFRFFVRNNELIGKRI